MLNDSPTDGKPLSHVVLYQPEIPQNAGNIGRTCVAVRAKLWFVRPLGFRMDQHHLRRAGLDYWQHLDWEIVDDWGSLENRLPPTRRWFFTRFAARTYTDARFTPGDVFVFGSETNGLPASLTSADESSTLRIPTAPEVRSLNLSNAVAIVVYEAVRQWTQPSLP